MMRHDDIDGGDDDDGVGDDDGGVGDDDGGVPFEDELPAVWLKFARNWDVTARPTQPMQFI